MSAERDAHALESGRCKAGRRARVAVLVDHRPRGPADLPRPAAPLERLVSHTVHLATPLVVVALALVAGCSELGAGTGQISKRLGEVTHDPAAREVDLAKLTSFGWDTFYHFKPGTTRDEICSVIGANRNQCGRIIRYERVPDTHVVLLFGLNGHLTHTELHALENGEFDVPQTEQGHPKSASVFRIRRSLGGEGVSRIILEPK